MEQYKTISFPNSESGSNQIERIRLKFPKDIAENFASWLISLHSSDFREMLHLSYTEIIELSKKESRSVSNTVMNLLKQIYDERQTNRSISPQQLNLFENRTPFGIKGTFAPNHSEAIHRWYPYIEGFSSIFVEALLDEYSDEISVYDPFAGTGTTVAVASYRGFQSYYSEINPYMRLVTECKTNHLRHVIGSQSTALLRYLEDILYSARENQLSQDDAYELQRNVFPEKEYFTGKRLIEITSLKRSIENNNSSKAAFKDFAKLVLGSICVTSSEMIRAADLRYRTKKEKLRISQSVYDSFLNKSKQIIDDVEAYNGKSIAPVILLSESSLSTHSKQDIVDLVITSPPYLNGTNYFRNTKLELWLSGFIKHETELAKFRQKAMAAGINNISKNSRALERIDSAEKIAKKLDEVSYDKRIPELVRRYFSDSYIWINNAYNLLKNGGTAIIDIGDSQYAGVHIPTDEVLLSISERCGFKVEEVNLVRRRRSKNGSPLKQVIITLKKNKTATGSSNIRILNNEYLSKAKDFSLQLPHLLEPYSKRNWGHGLHSLCSYQGKLKPSIAHFLVKSFSTPGQIVLDPMSGCGTIPLEAFIQGRRALGNDLQELGYILTFAKVSKGDILASKNVLDDLLNYVDRNCELQDSNQYASFGYNGKIPEYFHEKTLLEILAARDYIKKNPCKSWEQAIIYSCLLHILHGNRPYALSRRSHPVTPFKPTGDFIYKKISEKLREKVERTLNLSYGNTISTGEATNLPFECLPYHNEIDVVITSPPFAASTRFFMSNWMRLWFAGWEPEDFFIKPESFLEVKQKSSLDAYNDFFNCSYTWLKPGGILIMHLGRTLKCNMADELRARSSNLFDHIYSFDEDVSLREKFGIRDQGATTSHQYVFFQVRK